MAEKSVKVQLLPGHGIGGVGRPGDVVEMTPGDAKKWIKEGYVEAYDPKKAKTSKAAGAEDEEEWVTALVSAAEVRVLVKTSLTDAQLDAVIARVEALITEQVGAPQVDGGTVETVQTLEGEGCLLFLPTEITSVTSIVEDGTTLDAADYQIWPGGQIERLPADSYWGDRCVVTYKAADDRPKRTQAIIDLVRLFIERTAMQHESIASEYAYDAPDWEAETRKVIRRLTFLSI